MSGVRVELFDHLLLLAAVTCAATLVRLLRRNEGIGRGYAALVGVELLLSVFAMGADRFVGTVALSLVGLTVALPWALEHGSRFAFARGYLAWVARLSSLRASLMPGSGLAHQLPIIEGLALVETKNVDAALAHFRRLADEAEDSAEIAMIHEQIVAMLFYGQRWDEGIAHYERRFHVGYAALRPGLALGLLRAYGEAGQLETAARLLRELEDGPVGADPKTAELLGQARLTFLAYAGAIEPVDAIVERRDFVGLGLSPATAELFRGIAHARAGAPAQAVETLHKVEDLAGPRDRRVRVAARAVLERLGQAMRELGHDGAGGAGDEAGEVGEVGDGRGVELGPELRSYVVLVSARLERFFADAPAVRRHERPRTTYALIVALSAVYGVHALRGGGGMGLLELGAMSLDLWHGGSWGRVFTSTWIHADLVGLLFDVYAIWLAGQLVERLLGSARMALVTIAGAALGVGVTMLVAPATSAATSANLMAVGAITSGLWLLLPRFTPGLASRSRRNLLITLALLLLANLVTSWPSPVGLGAAPLALLGTAVFATALTLGLPRDLPRAAEIGLGALVVVVLGASGAAAGLVFSEDAEAELRDSRGQRCELGGVAVQTFAELTPMELDRVVPFELPILDGLLDSLELRDGGLVQLAVVRGAPAGVTTNGQGNELGPSALFHAVEGLEHELALTAPGPVPEPFAELLADDPKGVWRAYDLWRNGERVARAIERQLEVPEGAKPAVLVLVASPAEALDHGARVHAAIMRDAELVADPAEDGAAIRCSSAAAATPATPAGDP